MKKLAQATKKFWKDESGVTAIEYGLIASLLAVAIAAGVGLVGTNLDSMFRGIAGQIK